jgi:Flp pilus assembly protein TadG
VARVERAAPAALPLSGPAGGREKGRSEISRRKDVRRRGHEERGAVAVEFALLVPLIVMILFAIVEFGIAFTRTLAYASGAREGARYAAVHCKPQADTCTDTLIQDRIVASIPEGYPVTFTDFSAAPNCATAGGSMVTVTWEQGVPISVPFLPDMSWTIHPSGSFRCE